MDLITDLFFLFLFFFFLEHLWLYSMRWIEIANSDSLQIPRRAMEASRRVSRWGPFLAEYFYHLAALTLSAADGVRYLVARIFRMPPSPLLPSLEGEDSYTPVVLIPGYMMGPLTLYPLKWWLERQGLRPAVAISLNPAWGDLTLLAEQLKEKVEEVYESYGRTKVTLIGYSMGGLVARYYVSRLGGSQRVEKIVCLGTPHHGTKLWTFAMGPCALQIRPGSPFLLSLETDPSDSSTVPVVSLYSDFDEIVIPAESASLEGAHFQDIPMQALGHNAYLYSRRVYRKIQEILEPVPPGNTADPWTLE